MMNQPRTEALREEKKIPPLKTGINSLNQFHAFWEQESKWGQCYSRVSAVVLPTEHSLPVSPVDHLCTSRLTSCFPPTLLLPSNRTLQHLSVSLEESRVLISLFLSPPVSVACMSLLRSLPPSLPSFFPSLSLIPSSCSEPDTRPPLLQLPQLKLSTSVHAS